MTRALACALVIVGLATSAAVSQDVYVGTVTRIDPPARVVIFDDGRMYHVGPSTAFIVDNRPVTYTTLQPGMRVMVRGGEPVAFQNGQYVLISAPAIAPAPVVAPAPSPTPATTTTVVTTVTTPQLLASASGVVAGYDPWTNIVTLTDGRMVQLTSKTAILVNGHPTTPDALAPGIPVVLSAVNPVVSRDGRSALFNRGFFDASTGSTITWDSVYAGYEADIDNAAMQPQGGG